LKRKNRLAKIHSVRTSQAEMLLRIWAPTLCELGVGFSHKKPEGKNIMGFVLECFPPTKQANVLFQ
jgi:hypothetical protein